MAIHADLVTAHRLILARSGFTPAMLRATLAALDGFEIALDLDLRQQVGQQMQDAERTRLVAEKHDVELTDWERAVRLVKTNEPLARAVWVVARLDDVYAEFMQQTAQTVPASHKRH